MLTSEDFIRAGNVMNAFVMDSVDILEPEVLDAIQTLKDGCYEAIQIPRRVRGRFISGAKDELQMRDSHQG